MTGGVQELPSGMPIARRGLCMLAQPRLRQPQHANHFRFLEATILVVASGKLTLQNDEAASQLEGPSALMVIAQGTCADLEKTPGGPDALFHSVFLTLSPQVIREFYKRHEQDALSLPPVARWRELPLDDDLAETLNHCLRGTDVARVSDRGLQHRLLGLLLALADRGIFFARPNNHAVGDLVKALLSDAPGHQWTTAAAGRELAMSEATLRRRLAAENLRFEALLLEVRMHHAMTLLQTTNWSIQAVAHACGYQAASRFSSRFRERFGCSPSNVR